MDNGILPEYTEMHPEVNRLDLLVGVTRGLEYLHESEIVHGGLTSQNILIDAEGNPRLSGFGSSSITKNVDSVNASTANQGCYFRYSAPEVLNVDGTLEVKKTTKSDVYSLSMVIVELATGKPPFHDLQDFGVVIVASKGKRPPKLRRFDALGITSEVWAVAKKCWHQKPRERPEAKSILRDLEQIANPASAPRSAFFKKIFTQLG